MRVEVRSAFESVLLSLIFGSLELSRETCTERLLDVIIASSQNRLYGRLQSKHWVPQRYMSNRRREPLHEELRKLSSWVLQQRPKLRKSSRTLIQQLNELAEAFESFEFLEKGSSQSLQKLKEIVKRSHAFCTSNGEKSLEETIRGYGFTPVQILTYNRIEQVNKIGRYWAACVYMTDASRKYPKLFENIDVQTVIPYRGLKSPISPNMVFVHAEIQLVTFYGLNPSTTSLKPRILGTSKMACYLCNLFLLNYGRFFVTKTHGHLYPHWNVPDLAGYDQLQLREYRRVLAMMDEAIRKALIEQTKSRNLPHPMTSSANLPSGRQMSPLPSDAGTLISESLGNPIPDTTRFSAQSPAILVEHIDLQTPLANPVAVQDDFVPSPLRLPSPFISPRATQLSSATSFEQSPLPSIHPSVPDLPQPIYHQESISLSSTMIPSPTPVHRTLSEIAPLRLQAGKISANVEFEGPGRGKIHVQSNHDPDPGAPGTLIDLGTFLPNDSVLVERAESDDHLTLNLRYQHDSVLLSLQWGE